MASASLCRPYRVARSLRTVVSVAARGRSRSTAANPLLDQRDLPRFDAINHSHVEPAVTSVLKDFNVGMSELEVELADAAEPEYEDVLEAVERLQAPIEYTWGVVNHLVGVANSDALRDAHQSVQSDVVRTTTKMQQSSSLYKALTGIPEASLDEAQKRIVASSILSMKLTGVGLEGELKQTFNANRLRLSELSTIFSNNVLDGTKAFELLVTDKVRMAGLPPSAMAHFAQMAVLAGHKTASAENGPWKLGLDMPSYIPAMQHLQCPELRESLYRGFISRAGAANEALITEILQLRQDQASILGFNSYAEVSIEQKMAKSVEEVEALIEELRAKALPAAQQELAALTMYAKSHGFNGDKLNPWDITFWSERQSEELFGIEEEELRPYFPLPSVLGGLFGLCKRLFGVDIIAANGDAPVWHEDVQFFNVCDENTGEHLASFYLDPFSRPATKRGGAWMDVCVGKSKVLGTKPVAYLTCNGSPPVGDKPSLMTFQEVTTLFHETGHGLQHMLTEVEHAPASGISGVEWDAVELPSQFMENWCYDEKTLYGTNLATHYETGEPLPRELFAKLKERQKHHTGMAILRQLFFAKLDIELHHNYDPSGSTTPFEVQRSIADAGYTLMPPLPEDRFLCAFSHIFAGGYAAGYYSYLWAEVLSADAFAAFEEIGLENEDAVQAAGRRFRQTALALGGAKHPSEVYQLFRGKKPSPEALLRHRGLI